MVCTTCDNCGGIYRWDWTEAFYKFGFKDGSGQVETPAVAEVLERAGFTVYIGGSDIHNAVIVSLRKGSREYIPFDHPDYRFGYDDPRAFFPKEIIQLLDRAFPA